MPIIIQMYSIFKNRWCGAYWQDKGLRTVIPTITWGSEESFEFCFLGVEEGTAVAISTLNACREKELFMKGYNRMIEVIKPQLIYCYGVSPFQKYKVILFELNTYQSLGGVMMGGRGISSGVNTSQMTIEQHKDMLEIEEIIKEADNVRNMMAAKEEKKDERLPILYKKCYCCGEYTITLNSKYEKCYICGWIDDEFQNAHVYSDNGKNEKCLIEARKLFFESKKDI